MTEQKKFTKDMGDAGDGIITEDMAIYYATPPGKKPKVGSTNDPQRRQKQLHCSDDQFQVLMYVPAGFTSYNHVWKMEQVNARMLGLPSEHEGHRQIVNRVRVGALGKSGIYALTNTLTDEVSLVTEAGQFERQHELYQGALSKAAHPNSSHKFLVVAGVKYVVSRVDEVSGDAA